MKKARKRNYPPMGPPSVTEWLDPETQIKSSHCTCPLCGHGVMRYDKWCEKEVVRLNRAGGSMNFQKIDQYHPRPWKPVPVTIDMWKGKWAIVEAKK